MAYPDTVAHRLINALTRRDRSSEQKYSLKGSIMANLVRSTTPPKSRVLRPKPAQASAVTGVFHQSSVDFRQVFEANAIDWVHIVKTGVPAHAVEVIARLMAVPKEKLVSTLGLARATIDRKAREGKPLSIDESSRLLGMARLVGQVQVMVEESGDPVGFNAAEWLARWLERPLPALGGQRPAELMDTSEGQGIVAQLIARMQSGAYS